MSRMTAFVLAVLGSLCLPGQAFAQLTPPAGSAGAGNSAISGVPFGPANPRVLSDPSGIGNASSLPPLRSNPGPRGLLNTDGTDTGRHADFLSERVAADHQPVCHRAEKQGTASPARSPAGQLLHWHLPGLLERV